MAVKPIPDGYPPVTPYLIIPDVSKVIDFLKQVFGATETCRHAAPDGQVMHAEVRIGDSPIMMGPAREPSKAMPAAIYVYVTDVDATYRRAIAAGATSLMAPMDQFYGDRSGGVQDAVGNQWWMATHVEDVSPEEMTRRHAEYAKQQQH